MSIKPLVKEIKPQGSLEEIFSLFVNDKHPFWLDSSLPGGKMGRYSFMGSRPFLVLMTKGRRIWQKENSKVKRSEGNPFAALRKCLGRFLVEKENIPFPLPGGAVGFFSYDLGRMVEKLPQLAVDDLGVPDIFLGFYDKLLAVDHAENRFFLLATGLPLQGKEAAAKAETDLKCLEEKLRNLPCVRLKDPWSEKNVSAAEIKTRFSTAEYRKAVEKIKDYIAAGDIYQANMTQRLEAPLKMEPFQLYRRLRRSNPAPFASYLDCGGGLRVLSSSPERFLLLEDGMVETRPIKGTRPRGRTPEEDKKNREELLSSEKDRAELVMIVDLERNDLGRVCSYGSVRVPELIVLEEYATVFHLVSTVKGKLAPQKDIVDLLKATFPGGSITGAPKIRAMEIIEELEPVRRGIYTGSIGYIGFDGRADLNIAIRTLVNKNDRLYLQVGGGIVADSDPQLEYEETLHKAKALLKSLGVESFPEVKVSG